MTRIWQEIRDVFLPNDQNMTRDHGEGDDKIEIWLYANENKSPCGLMDKALDFEFKDCGFESHQG